MNRMKVLFLLCVIISIGLFSCTGKRGNSPQRKTKGTEQKFIDSLYDIYRSETIEDVWDIQLMRKMNVDYISQLIRDNPQILDLSFEKSEEFDIDLPEYFSLTTSNDSYVRGYNIQTNMKPTNSLEYNYRHFIQFRHNGNVYLKEIIDYFNSPFCIDKIYTVKEASLYLLSFRMGIMMQGSHYSQIIKAYEIDSEGNFNSKKLFRTKKDILDEIEVLWDYGCIEHNEIALRKEGYDDEIVYDCSQEKLLVPLVINVSGGSAMTEGNLVYQWRGSYFEYMGIEPIAIFETQKFRIQIDIMNNGKYRYRSWSKGENSTNKPDLELKNGTKEYWNELGNCDYNEINPVLGKRYLFKSGNYVYIYEKGWRKGRSINELTVWQNGDVILKEEIE